ncbi:uncharacterized protein LOC144710251 isoform X1 [Wolffia australiana]
MQGLFVQNVLVMRHGDRIDDSEPLWALQAARPWDPPLAKDGEIRAWATGRRLRPRNLGFRLHRVLVSPFLRCLQTAAAVVSALCAKCEEEASLMAQETGAGVPIDRSAVKVSIEYGLSEVMSSRAINVDRVPQDGKWFPDISELESFLPAGTVDHSSERMCHQTLPPWEEELGKARMRYKKVITAIADKYPNENILLITHGEGVGTSIASFMVGYEAWEVDFCAFSHLQRKIHFTDSTGLCAEPFKVLDEEVGQNGIQIYSVQEEMSSA